MLRCGTLVDFAAAAATCNVRRSRKHLALRSPCRRGRRPGVLGRHPRLRGRRGLRQAQVLLPVDAAVSVRRAAHGPCAQLHHRRCDQPLQAHDRPQRAAADGLGRVRPAGRERGDQEQGATGAVDLQEHRPHAQPAQVAGLRHRLVARVRHLHAGLLRPRAAHVHPADAQGPGLPQELGGELGPGRPDRAGQRAGDRRPRLAYRGAGGEEGNPRLLPEDHRLRAGIAGPRAGRQPQGHARGLARARAPDAGKLDRQERGRALCLHPRDCRR